jgi:hypothetical protein
MSLEIPEFRFAPSGMTYSLNLMTLILDIQFVIIQDSRFIQNPHSKIRYQLIWICRIRHSRLQSIGMSFGIFKTNWNRLAFGIGTAFSHVKM